jgi:hypothetical protein
VRQQIDILLAGKCASRVEREALVYEFLCLRSDRDGIKEAHRVYDGITYSAPYRFITISNYIQERMDHKDYVGRCGCVYQVMACCAACCRWCCYLLRYAPPPSPPSPPPAALL